MIKILNTGDLQINIRNKDLSSGYEKTLIEIENIIKEKEIDIYVFSGDIFENFPVNDIERKMFYKHLGNVLNISTFKELVIMNGNHDLPRNKKVIDLEKENNALDTFVNTSQYLSEELNKKITYLKLQKEYVSKVDSNLVWVSYSLEDGMSNGSNLQINPDNKNKYRIPIYHDILDEYVVDKGLPVSQNKRQYLANMDTFVLNPLYKNLIIASDIHENWSFHKDNKMFFYGGSPVQRNYGEGSYLKIGKKPIYKQAEQKVVKYIELTLAEQIENTNYVVTDLPLKNHINYITINFNTKFFVEDWQVQLNELLNSVEFSENINNIKIEFSSFYMKHEIEILNIVNNKINLLNSVNYLEPIYGTIIFKEENDIILSDDNEDIDNEIELDIDDISLDTEKLSLIFAKILENNAIKIKKEFIDPVEYEEIINEIQTLFNEQINLVYGNKTTFNIELENIYTNGFMALGENTINLDIPGLTRIVANNGIGKTTLFNMIRYIIKNFVIEGLPKNKTKENLLLIFNDTLYDLDYLTNKMNLKINNLPFCIERNIKRIWKASATIEQKKSKNWRKYIDTVSSTLKLTKFKEDGDTVLLNDEAQKYIDTFFGNVTESILILNQFKILGILNSNGEKLQELILDYIGIDYLKNLVTNLDTVKIDYITEKPNISQLDIITEKNKINKTLSENKILTDEIELKKVSDSTELKNSKENLILVDTKLIKFGDIPLNLKNTQIELDANQLQLNNFEFKQIKLLPKFELIEPVKPSTTELNENLSKLKINFDKLTEENKTKFNDFNSLRLEKITKIDDQVKLLTKENEDYLTNKSLEFLNENDSNILKINEIKKDYINSIEEFKNSTIELNDVLLIKEQKILDENNLKYNNLIAEINLLSSKINNAICISCNKPLELTVEEIEQFKLDKISKDNEAKTLLESINAYKIEIEAYKTKNNTINNDFNNLKLKLNWDSTQNALIILENEIKVLEEINCNRFLDLKPLYDKSIENHNKSLNLIKSEEYIKKNNLITQLNTIKNTYVSVLSISTEDLTPFRTIKFVEDLILILDLYNKNLLDISQINKEIDIIKNKIELDTNEYNTKLKTYQTEYQNHLNKTNEINEENKSVNEHNASQSELITKIELNRKSIEQFNNDLPLFEKLSEEKRLENLNIDRLNQLLSNYELSLNSYEINEKNSQLKLSELTLLEDAWKLYKFKNYIYKTFEKFIKNDFKYAIFNYYRQYLNKNLNILLEGLDFRLYWNEDSDLYLVSLDKDLDGNSELTYRPVKLASGMQTTFLSLALVYSIHLMNTKNNISHIFIDEISGQLNDGKNVNDVETEEEIIDKTNYQDKLVKLLAKFDKKKIFVVDHVVQSLFETHTYYVVKKRVNNKIVSIYK